MFNLGSLFAWFFVVEWVIRIVMVFIVPRKIRPSSANAWLLLILFSPMVGTILFYMFGNPKLPKSRRENLKKVTTLTQTEIKQLHRANSSIFSQLANDDYQTIAKLATKLGGLPPMKGNTLTFLTDYEQIFVHIAREIDSATQYVHVQYFIAILDGSTMVVFDAIERAVARGVTVRFMYDKVLSKRHGSVSPMLKRLKSLDIEVVEMLPLSLVPGRSFTRPDLRNHRKIVVIDGHTAFSGSQNLIASAYNRIDGLYYQDVVAHMRGPVVWQLNTVFRADWFAETGQPLLDVVEDEDIPPKVGDSTVQVLPSGPSHDHDNNLKLYTAMVHAAKKQVRIVVPYFIPDESLMDAITAAAQRGVDVTMINSQAIDKLFAGHAQRSYYEDLLQVGVRIYLYAKPVFLHTKQVIIDDDVAIVGSSNLDIRSFELDFEVNTIIYDKPAVQQLKAIEADYLERSVEITLDAWRTRPLHLRMLATLARLTAGLQ